MGVVPKVFSITLAEIQATSVTQGLGLSRKESGYSFRTCAFRLLLFLRTRGVYKVRSGRTCLGSSLHVKVQASLGEMALRKRASGNPRCECGRSRLAVLSPELQEAWAKDKGVKWGTRPGWSEA